MKRLFFVRLCVMLLALCLLLSGCKGASSVVPSSENNGENADDPTLLSSTDAFDPNDTQSEPTPAYSFGTPDDIPLISANKTPPGAIPEAFCLRRRQALSCCGSS